MAEQSGRNWQSGSPATVDGFAETVRVPVDDDGREQIQTRDAVVLALGGAVAYLALAADPQGRSSARDGTRLRPSRILRQLAAFPRRNDLAAALREVGRVERTLFMIDWALVGTNSAHAMANPTVRSTLKGVAHPRPPLPIHYFYSISLDKSKGANTHCCELEISEEAMKASMALAIGTLLTLALGIGIEKGTAGQHDGLLVNETVPAYGTPDPVVSRGQLDDLLLMNRSSSFSSESCYYDGCSDYECGYMCPPDEGCSEGGEGCTDNDCTYNEECHTKGCYGGCWGTPGDMTLKCHRQIGF